MSPSLLEGRVAVITGASSGIGRQIAESLAAAGAAVALLARNQRRLQEVAAAIREQGGSVEVCPADVTDENAIERVAGQVSGKLGTCDILVNNAGINIRRPLEEFTRQDSDRVVDTNLTAPFVMCQTFVPGMRKKKFGRIINITSIMAHISLPNRTAYSATKAGLLGLTKCLALELAPYNITANGISPGPIATETLKPLIEDPEKKGSLPRACSPRSLGASGRGRFPGRVSLLRRGGFHHGDGHCHRRRLDGPVAPRLQRQSPARKPVFGEASSTLPQAVLPPAGRNIQSWNDSESRSSGELHPRGTRLADNK